MEKVINRLMIIALAAAVLFGAAAFHYRNAEHDSAYREELSFPMYEYIDIDLLKLPVTMIPYDKDKISVSYTSDLPLIFSTGDNLLKVTESEKFVISLFAGNRHDYGLYIYLPDRLFRDINIYTGAGSVSVGRIDCNNLSVITNSGDIRCDNLISQGSFTTTSGSISVNFNEIITEAELFSRRGDAEIQFPKKSSVAVEFETLTGSCVTDLWEDSVMGSNVYSYNGGKNVIKATLEKGTLTIKEKG